MDSGERALLESTVGDAIAAADATAIDTALTELGWLEMLDAEPRAAIEIVFHALGETNAAASALDDVMVSALGIAPRADLAVLLPAFGTWDPPGDLDGDHVHADGIATARASVAREFVVVCTSGTDRYVLTVPSTSVDVRPVHGIDPDAGCARVHVDSAAGAGVRLDRDAWEAAVALGRRAVAHQISGATRSMLALARTHALERVQFGRAIVRFQAVRHRLAETLVAIEALDATLAAAADERTPLTAALAKATAGRTAQTVAAHCQQVLAGIGFTTDHPFHRFLKRTMLLEGLLGSSDDLAVAIGRQLLDARRVPTLIEL